MLLFALAPDAMVGWVPPPVADAKPFLVPAARDLPASIRWTGHGGLPGMARVEVLRPDLIVDFGSTLPAYVTLADRVQAATRIPNALIDGGIDRSATAFRLAGDMLGRRERAERLAACAEKTLSLVDGAMTKVPVRRRPRVYVARGSDGLLTRVRGSGLTEIVERVGAVNVAEGTAERGGGLGVSFEQVTAWRPDIVIAFDRASFAAIRRRPEWRRIVEGKRVVAAPTLP